MLISQLREFVKVRNITVHTENGVADKNFAVAVSYALEQVRQMVEVVMAIPGKGCARKSTTGIEAGMVEFVGNDNALSVSEGREDADVSQITGTE